MQNEPKKETESDEECATEKKKARHERTIGHRLTLDFIAEMTTTYP
jgi:hypothetical protein